MEERQHHVYRQEEVDISYGLEKVTLYHAVVRPLHPFVLPALRSQTDFHSQLWVVTAISNS